MKMMKTETEFVTFDAQDVIATSGPFVNQPLAVQIGTISVYNSLVGEGDKLKNQNGYETGFSLATKQYNWLWYGVIGEINGAGDEFGTGVKYLRSANDQSRPDKPTGQNFLYVNSADDISLITQWLNLQRGQ